MEPQIRYARTADGVSIAYFEAGQGAPLLVLPTIPWSDIRSEFSGMTFKFHSRLAERHRLIRYDVRGAGLSQREVADCSSAGLLFDIEAVVDAVGVDRVSLYAESNAARVALAYAAEHPDRVDRLILWGGFSRAIDFWQLPRLRAVHSLFELGDWQLYTETLAQVTFGLASGAPAQHYAAYMRSCVNESAAAAYFAADRDFDVTPVLSRIVCPTLLLHPSDASIAPISWGRELAASIPNAQLSVLNTSVLWSDQIEDWIVAAIDGFLPGAPPTTSNQDRTSHEAVLFGGATGTAVILFTDIADSTALTERMGDTRFRDASRALDAELRAAIRDAGGAAVDGKLLGDGVLATFPSAAQAIGAARRCLALSAASELGLHIGLHAGDVIREEGNVFGGAVNIASRICGLSAPGEILVSDVVRGMARSSAGVEFEDRGEQLLKGIEDSVRVFAVPPAG